MNAKNISTELKAAYLIGLFAGTNSCKTKKMTEYRKRLYPHVLIAAQIVYEGGSFNPIAVHKMVKFYNHIVDESERQSDERSKAGKSSFDDIYVS